MQQNIERYGVGRHPLAAILERLPRIRERKTGAAVEGLPISTLIVEITRDRRVEGEQSDDHTRKTGTGQQHASIVPSQERERERRCDQDHVCRLGERGNTQQNGRRIVRSVRAKKAFEPAVGLRRRRDELVSPQEIGAEHDAEVEDLRHQPEEVDGHDRREDEDGGKRGGHDRLRAKGLQKSGRDREAEREQERVEHEKAVGAKHADEGRREQRIDVRLRVIETVTRRIFRPDHVNEWKP